MCGVCLDRSFGLPGKMEPHCDVSRVVPALQQTLLTRCLRAGQVPYRSGIHKQKLTGVGGTKTPYNTMKFLLMAAPGPRTWIRTGPVGELNFEGSLQANERTGRRLQRSRHRASSPKPLRVGPPAPSAPHPVETCWFQCRDTSGRGEGMKRGWGRHSQLIVRVEDMRRRLKRVSD